MASFGLFAVDDVGSGSLAGAVAGLVNATAPAVAAAAAGGDVERAPGVSARVVTWVQIAGNVASLIMIIVPFFKFAYPIFKAKRVDDRNIYGFVYVFCSATLWLVFAVPADHRDTFTVIVNSLAVTAQVLYVGLYLFYAKDDKFDFAWRLALIALAITFGILIVEGPMVLLHKWSVKVIGVTASTVSTGIIVSGVFDIVHLVKKQRSVFNYWQLGANIQAACIWTSYSFLFRPFNKYVAIPNMVGIAVILGQLFVHRRHIIKKRNNPPPNNEGAPVANQV